jgi:hypothetical protein
MAEREDSSTKHTLAEPALINDRIHRVESSDVKRQREPLVTQRASGIQSQPLYPLRPLWSKDYLCEPKAFRAKAVP